MQKLHPGARWLFRVGFLFGLAIPGFFLAFFLSVAFSNWFIFIIVLAAILIFAEVYARMAYNRWFYEFTKDNLKIERGIIWKKYSNIPYARVQNVDVHRGIIARFFGFSTVSIQTAGYSGQVSKSEGNLAVGIEDAERIREFLMKKISKKRER